MHQFFTNLADVAERKLLLTFVDVKDTIILFIIGMMMAVGCAAFNLSFNLIAVFLISYIVRLIYAGFTGE